MKLRMKTQSLENDIATPLVLSLKRFFGLWLARVDAIIDLLIQTMFLTYNP